jgi:cytochrome oxidase complex assembly protein 1
MTVVCAFYLTSASLKSTDVMQEALARAQNSAAINETLGAPVELGWYVKGSVTYQALFGDADVSAPIGGPKGKGSLTVSARRTNGIWEFMALTVTIDGGRVISLQ